MRGSKERRKEGKRKVLYRMNNKAVYLALSRTEVSAEPREPPAPLELALALVMDLEVEGEGEAVGADSCCWYILVIRRDLFLWAASSLLTTCAISDGEDHELTAEGDLYVYHSQAQKTI